MCVCIIYIYINLQKADDLQGRNCMRNTAIPHLLRCSRQSLKAKTRDQAINCIFHRSVLFSRNEVMRNHQRCFTQLTFALRHWNLEASSETVQSHVDGESITSADRWDWVQFRVSSETGDDESCLVLNISRKLQDVLQDVFLDRDKKALLFYRNCDVFLFWYVLFECGDGASWWWRSRGLWENVKLKVQPGKKEKHRLWMYQTWFHGCNPIRLVV